MVVALIALFVALGGTAAALQGANTVQSDDLGPGAQVKAADVADNAVNSADIKNGQVKTQDLARSIPAARVTRTANQTIPNSDVTAIAFNSERYDTAAMHSNTTNASRLTAPVVGIYNITLQVEWGLFDPDGIRYIELIRNGTTEIAIDQKDPNNGLDQQVTTQAKLRAGDFVQARVQQTSGGQLPIYKSTSHEYSPELSMTWLARG
jgi:hypothetical protein